MATRVYDTPRAPAALFRGAAQGAWGVNGISTRPWMPDQQAHILSTNKVEGGVITSVTMATNQESDYDLYLGRAILGPLDAQTISGDFDLCMMVRAIWDDGSQTNDTIARYKVHIYVCVGEDPTQVRGILLDNYVDSVDWPRFPTGQTWRSLAAPQTLTNVNAQAGDYVVVERGVRIVSSPTPAPTYPPSANSLLPWRSGGTTNAAGVVAADATAGTTTTTSCPWFEFSHTFVMAAAPAAPANDACADAEVIAAVPYTSAFVVTQSSADANRAVWWEWTAPEDGIVFATAQGSNYLVDFDVFTGGCGVLSFVSSTEDFAGMAGPRCLSVFAWSAVQGTSYLIRMRQATGRTASNAPNSGGVCRLSVFYREAPAVDNLYLPNGVLQVLRDGQYVNLSSMFTSQAPSGLAIDYSGRPMDDFNGGISTAVRIYLGLHSTDLVEILDATTFNQGGSEIDFINAPWADPVTQHPAQAVIPLTGSRAGLLHQAWFGNGYLFVAGTGTGFPAVLNTVSDNADYSALKVIDAVDADNQPGAPFADTLSYPTIELTAPWAISIDETTNTLYYTSAGFYLPVGGATNVIGRFDLDGNTPLSAFATLALQPGNNPGLKGLRFIPGGGLLVCNSTVVQRLDATGAIIQTYTPSIALDSQSLCDVQMTADGLQVWTIDEATTRIFLFDLATGVEVATYQPYGSPGTLVQMAIYQPEGVLPPEPPPPTCPGVTGAPRTDGLPYAP